jgi:hypothetical protein
MANPDCDPNIADKDKYGNITAKNQKGITADELYGKDINNPHINGFEDVPAECEDLECSECKLNDTDKKSRDCPYVNS